MTFRSVGIQVPLRTCSAGKHTQNQKPSTGEGSQLDSLSVPGL